MRGKERRGDSRRKKIVKKEKEKKKEEGRGAQFLEKAMRATIG